MVYGAEEVGTIGLEDARRPRPAIVLCLSST
jgi:hypothetical protein